MAKKEHLRAYVLASGLEYNADKYEFDTSFKPANLSNPWEIHTTAELVAFLERNPNTELDARVLSRAGLRSINRESFVNAYHENNEKMRESDPFSMDNGYSSLVGDDFTPFLGGPFYKNLYFYQDYIRMHSMAFYAYSNDPVARAIVNMMVNFTLGRGFRVDSENKEALALWRAFEKANDLPSLMRDFAKEFSIYGEQMLWWLPNNESAITYQLKPGQEIPHALIPRVRLVDPSNITEIITFPEDITRRVSFVWLAPTQYQIYSKSTVTSGADSIQPSLKFIYRQIPAEQMDHFTVNSVSNEKRGRSDLFPVLGYLKRLRDAVEFEMIAHQKQSAWAIDTSIEGAQSDIDAYIQAQASIGTVAPAGSEFVHSTKIKRSFVSPETGSGSSEEIFKWCLSMIAAGSMPVSYFGTHLSGGATRAGAVVSTEPVAKMFETRQLAYEGVIKKMWDRVMAWGGVRNAECEVTFPDIITQDRSAKLKDLALAQSQGWISKERAATIAAKELAITEYDFNAEMENIGGDEPALDAPAPLSLPGKAPSLGLPSSERKDAKSSEYKPQ